MKYRKKPVVIDAVQWDGHNREDICYFVGKDLECELESETAYLAGQGAPHFSLIIPTLEGNMKAMNGDWIIKGVNGEFYPCKPDIFAKTYAPASQPSAPTEAASVSIGQYIRAMTPHMAEQHMRHDYRSMWQIWEMLIAKNDESSTPPTAAPEAAKAYAAANCDCFIHDGNPEKDCNYSKLEAAFVTGANYTSTLPASTALNDGWISVEERLPEDVYGEDAMPESYLVYNPDNWAGIVYRVSIRENKIWFGGDKSDNVTHWQPLPTPPKK